MTSRQIRLANDHGPFRVVRPVAGPRTLGRFVVCVGCGAHKKFANIRANGDRFLAFECARARAVAMHTSMPSTFELPAGARTDLICGPADLAEILSRHARPRRNLVDS